MTYALAISLPGVIEHFGNQRVSAFLDQGILGALVLASLIAVLKLFPNTRVSWKSATIGALSGTIGFAASNSLLRIYFKIGTNTAYGKAAILPIIAFFIYVAWMIFIFAVEVSLLVEEGSRMIERKMPATTLGQALVLEKLVKVLEDRFKNSLGPASVHHLAEIIGVGPSMLEPLLDVLERKKWIIRSSADPQNGAFRYAIAHEVMDQDLLLLIKDFLNLDRISQNFDVFRLISMLKAAEDEKACQKKHS
jgi:hypothetical protein